MDVLGVEGGCLGGSPFDLLQMVAQELRHREGTHTLGAEDLEE